MNKTWLILDCNFLCWRAWYTTGQLSHGDIQTGVIYGFLRDIVSLQDRFQPDLFIFTFDLGIPLRVKDYPEYKSARRNKGQTEEEVEFRKHFDQQLRRLREVYLGELGYENIFYKQGYEADDIIAKICKDTRNDTRIIIVSSDHDLFQLLSDTVAIFNPSSNKIYTHTTLKFEYGVTPREWIDVKAIAGCSTDSIKGIDRVGEKTAAKYIAGGLKFESKAYQAIENGKEIWRRNKKLIKLPYPGLNSFTINEDEKVVAQSWELLVAKLGMKTLEGKAPKRSNRRGFGLA